MYQTASIQTFQHTSEHRCASSTDVYENKHTPVCDVTQCLAVCKH